MSVHRVLIILGFLLAVQAFAQFEISPDHFDSVETPRANHVKAHKKIKDVHTPLIARKGRQRVPKATGSKEVSSSQAVNAGSRESSTKTNVASHRKPALKTRTVSVLQPIGRSQEASLHDHTD